MTRWTKSVVGIGIACATVMAAVAARGQDAAAPAKDPQARIAELEKELQDVRAENTSLRLDLRAAREQSATLSKQLAELLEKQMVVDQRIEAERLLRQRVPGEQAVPEDWIPRGQGPTMHYLIPLQTTAAEVTVGENVTIEVAPQEATGERVARPVKARPAPAPTVR